MGSDVPAGADCGVVKRSVFVFLPICSLVDARMIALLEMERLVWFCQC